MVATDATRTNKQGLRENQFCMQNHSNEQSKSGAAAMAVAEQGGLLMVSMQTTGTSTKYRCLPDS